MKGIGCEGIGCVISCIFNTKVIFLKRNNCGGGVLGLLWSVLDVFHGCPRNATHPTHSP